MRLARCGPPHPAHGVKMRYANPIDGGYVYPTIAIFIQWLPKDFSGQTYRTTEGMVFKVVEGSGHAHIGDEHFAFEPHDVFVVPPWTPYHLRPMGNACCLAIRTAQRRKRLVSGATKTRRTRQAGRGLNRSRALSACDTAPSAPSRRIRRCAKCNSRSG